MGCRYKCVLLLFTLFETVHCQANGVGKYICDADANLHLISLEVYSFTPKALYAFENHDECTSLAKDGDGKFAISGGPAGPFKAVINTDNAQCGVIEEGTEYKTTLIATQAERIIQFGDLKFTFVCDTEQTAHIVERNASVELVTGELEEGHVEKDIPVDLSVVNADGSAVDSSSLDLGTDVKLQMIQQTGGPVKEGKVTNCIASLSPDFINPIDLFDDNGCTVAPVFEDGNGQFELFELSSDQLTYRSTTFKVFRFPSGVAVYIKCTYTGCVVENDPGCEVTCNGKRRRRRRDLATNSSMKTYGRSVLIFINDKPHKKIANGSEITKDQNNNNCLNHLTFISVVAILFLLLVISVVLALFFCSRILRQKSKQKECPSYKT